MRNCIIRRTAAGRVERVFNPIALNKSTFTAEFLAFHLNSVLNQPVIMDEALMREKLNELGYDNLEAMISTRHDSPHQIQFLQTLQGEVYGFTSEGKIYLDPQLLNSNTLFHEFDHINHSALQRAASRGDSKAQAILSKRKETVASIIDRVKNFLTRKFGVQEQTPVEFDMKMSDGSTQAVRRLPENLELVNGWYSPIENALLSFQQNKGTASQFLSQLKKAKGVKKDELEFTGVEQFLQEQGDNKITKQDILDYMKENRIEVVEVVKLDKPLSSDKFDIDFRNGEFVVTRNGVDEKTFESDARANDYIAQQEILDKSGITKFSQYQLEGEKENYKEVLVTLPVKYSLDNLKNFFNSKDRKGKDFDNLTRDEFIDLQNEYRKSKVFKSSHFDEPNILVHLRMNTRTDADGNKVLFLDEIQGDWGQIGKKEGFTGEEKVVESEGAYKIQKKDGSFIKAVSFELNEIGKKSAEQYIKDQRPFVSKIPKAPFVTDTPSWVKLGLKVALKEAVAQGATKIAWTTGEQQNDRYDLSKQVDEITYSKYPDGTYQFSGSKNDILKFVYQRIPENKLEDYVGKEVANKIINSEGDVISYGNKEEGTYGELGKTLSGVDLKVGGKGMEVFYGSPTEKSLGIVGNVAKSLFKQEPKTVVLKTKPALASSGAWYVTVWKDGKFAVNGLDIEPVIFNTKEEAKAYKETNEPKPTSTQYSIDVTPELKASVEQGLPLFDVKGEQSSETLGIESSVYAQRPNETDAQWTERLEGEIMARLVGEEGQKIAKQLEKDLNLKPTSLISALKQLLKDLVEWIKSSLPNFKDMSDRDILNMSISDFIKTSAGDLITQGAYRTQQNLAQEQTYEQTYYTQREREAIDAGGEILQTLTEDTRIHEGQYSEEDVFNQLRAEYPEIDLGALDTRLGEEAGYGTEALVWANPENNTVVKAISPDMEGSLSQLLDKIVVHNTIFPETAMKVLGISTLSTGVNTVVVEQPFIDFSSQTLSREEVVEFMRERGFEPTSNEVFPSFTDGRMVISDLHEGNIGVTQGGNIGVIDFFADINRQAATSTFSPSFKTEEVSSPVIAFQTEVSPPPNTESQAYENIVTNPHIATEEEALTLLYNLYSENFIKQFGEWENGEKIDTPFTYEEGEPKIFYRTPEGVVTDNFAKALQSTTAGEIEMGAISTPSFEVVEDIDMFNSSQEEFVQMGGDIKLNNPDAFITLATLPSENDNSYNGFVNKYIRQNILSPQKIKSLDGEYKLAGRGENVGMRAYNSVIATDQAILLFGSMNVKNDAKEGTIVITPQDPDAVVIDGKSESKDKLAQDLKEGKVEAVRKKVVSVGEFAYNHYRQQRDAVHEVKEEVSDKEEQRLITQLLKFLGSLGINVTSITDYVNNYSVRNGVDLTANAIADLANKVVAFAKGEITADTLSEEVAHIIVEAYQNQDEVEAILGEVEGSQEWIEFADLYYEKFAPLYKGEQLDRAVRREILGKILARNIREQFETSTSPTILETIINMFTRFFDRVSAFLTRGKEAQLNKFLNKATDIALRKQSALSMKNLESSSMIYYSASESVSNAEMKSVRRKRAQLLNLKQSILTNIQLLERTRDPEASRLKLELSKLDYDILNQDLTIAGKVAVDVHDRQVKSLQKKLESFDRGGQTSATKVFFNAEDQALYRYLTNTAAPILSQLAISLKNTNPSLARKLTGINDVINDMKTKAQYLQDSHTDAIVERILDTYNLPESERDVIIEAFNREQNDVSWISSKFFQLEHSSNAFLNLLGKIIDDVYFKAQHITLEATKPFLKIAQEKGWNIGKFRNLLQKNADGSNSQYLLSERDYVAYNRAKKEYIDKWYEENLTTEQKENIGERTPTVDDLNEEQTTQLQSHMHQWSVENDERIMRSEYYEQVEKDYIEAGIGQENRQFLSSIQSSAARIKSKYRRADGTIDYSTMSEVDFDELTRLALYRKERKSDFDASTGEMKSGKELEAAKELQRLDEIRSKRAIERGTSEEFFNALREVENTQGAEKAYNFLVSNGGLVFNDEFWNRIKESESTIDRIDKLIADLEQEGEDLDRIAGVKEVYEHYSNVRKEIIKQFISPNNPAEILVDNMSDSVKQNIMEASEKVSEAIQDLNSILKSRGETTVREPFTETTLNEAYKKDLIDSELSELDFILKNSSKLNQNKASNFELQLKRISEGKSDHLSKANLRFLEAYYPEYMNDLQDKIEAVIELVKEEGLEEILTTYAKRNIADYYKRFAPLGYEQLLEDLKTGKQSVYELAKTTNSYNKEVEAVFKREGVDRKEGIMELSPSAQQEVMNIENKWEAVLPGVSNLNVTTKFEWAEVDEEYKLTNPDFFVANDGAISMPKLSKYRNNQYYERFGIDANGQPTRNREDFDMIQRMRSMNQQMNEKYKEPRNINLIPSIRKSGIETLTDASISSAVERAKDIIKNREDEMDYGQQLEGLDTRELGMNLIPKYYRVPLEDDGDVSHDLAYTFTKAMHEAFLYEQRTHAIGDVLLLQQDMISKRWAKGKEGTNTNAYNMFKNFMDMYFFGVKSTQKVAYQVLGKEIDVSKAVRMMDNFVRKMNIGFSPFIAFSSAFLSQINLQVERVVGEHVQSGSVSWASKEFTKQASEYGLNYGKIGRNDKMYVLAENLGLHSVDDRVSNASFGTITKAISDSPFSMLTVGAIPHSSIAMLSVLDDMRLIGGRFFTYNEFIKRAENEGKTKAALKLEWKKLREQSLYNLSDTSEGVIKPKEGVEIDPEYFQSQVARARTKVKSVTGNIDALVSDTDKAAATRHFAANLLMAHRGWLTIGLQRRFKNQHFNFKTGEVEMGHYRALLNFIKDYTKLLRKNGMANAVKSFYEVKDNFTEVDIRNIQRVSLEAAIFIIMGIFGKMLLAYDDDDENRDNYALHFTSLLYARTLAEMGSTQIPFGGLELVDTIKTPFVAVTALSQLLDGWSFDEVRSGAYKGHSKFSKMLMKQTWIRHFKDVQNADNLKSKLDAYRHFNSQVLFMLQKDTGQDEDFNPYSIMAPQESLMKGIRRGY